MSSFRPFHFSKRLQYSQNMDGLISFKIILQQCLLRKGNQVTPLMLQIWLDLILFFIFYYPLVFYYGSNLLSTIKNATISIEALYFMSIIYSILSLCVWFIQAYNIKNVHLHKSYYLFNFIIVYLRRIIYNCWNFNLEFEHNRVNFV